MKLTLVVVFLMTCLCKSNQLLRYICGDDKVIEVSSGQSFANGSVLFNEKMYRKETQIKLLDGKILVCPCLIHKCYRKCCKSDEVYNIDFDKCIKRGDLEVLITPHMDFLIAKSNRLGYTKFTKIIKRFEHIENKLELVPIYGFINLLKKCKDESKLISTTLLDGHFNLSYTGKLLVTTCNKTEKYNVDNYCFDAFFWYNQSTEEYDVAEGAYFCRRTSHNKKHVTTGKCEDQIEVKVLTQNFTGIFVSSVFIFLTIILQLLLPEATNNKLYRYNMLAHLSSMLAVSLFIAMTRLFVKFQITTDYTVRVIFSVIIYFAFLATFFWLNVMCFDVWKTLSGRRGRVLPGDVSRMFYIYCAYALGFPTGLAMIFLFLEIAPLENSRLPKMRREENFLNGITKDIYLKVPIGVICVLNATLVLMTAISITINIRSNSQVLTGTGNTVHSAKDKFTRRLKAYMKLFVVTCLSMFSISWYLEVLSDMFPESIVLWKIHDFFDYISGLLTFICISGNRNTLRAFKNKFFNNRMVSKATLDAELSTTSQKVFQSGLSKDDKTPTTEDPVKRAGEFDEKVVTKL